LNEGGHSAAGRAAIDHLLTLHPVAPQVRAIAAEQMELPQRLARQAPARPDTKKGGYNKNWPNGS